MSNFFRDTSVFKARPNIFSKLRNKDPNQDGDSGADSDFASLEYGTSHADLLDPTPFRDDTGATLLNSIVESTPNNKRDTEYTQSRRLAAEEEELEITGVRQISHADLKKALANDNTVKEKLSELKFTHDLNDTSTHDVLLEAFTNTQKICSNLKVELQRQKAENQQQNQIAEGYKTELSKIEERLTQYKQSLLSIEEKASGLQTQKNASEQQLIDLRENYDVLLKRVRNYSKDCGMIKKALDETRSLQKSTESNMSRKLKELEYLKKELDDCSGQLTEEKLKNRELMQEIKALREQSNNLLEGALKKMDTDIKKELKLVGNTLKAGKNMTNFSLQEMKHLSDAMHSQLKNGNNSLSETFHQNFQQAMSSFEESFNSSFITNMENIRRELGVLNQIGQGMETLTKNVGNADKAFLKTVEQPISSLDNTMAQVLNSMKVITVDLKQYKDQVNVRVQQDQKAELLREKLQAVTLQKSEAVGLIKTKDVEIENLTNDLFAKSNALGKAVEEHDNLKRELCHAQNSLLMKEEELVKLSQELNMTKVNCESKLFAQCEIVKLLSGERDSLKLDLEKATSGRTEAEKEKLSAKSRTKKVNEQVQTLNVEVVQLKAKELELDEENRKLRNTVEQLNLDARDSSDQTRENKRRIAELENEKKEIANHLLESQDKISFLEQQLQATRKQLQNSKELHHKPPQIKKPASKMDSTQRHRSPRAIDADSEKKDDDAFDLSSSSNDDLEMTNPSPVAPRLFKTRAPTSLGKVLASARTKKILLVDEGDGTDSKHRGRKKRKA